MHILKSQAFEISLTILVNFLLDFIPLSVLMWGLYIRVVPFPTACVIFSIILLRVTVLPIYYRWLEKRTQNEILKNFIQNLKNDLKTKLIILFPISWLFTYISICLITGKWSFVFLDIDNFSLASLLLGSMGNYLALFTYWFIVDLYKKN